FNSLHYLITTLQLPSSTLFPYTTLFRSITGSMCNNFFGEGYFSSHGVLKAKGLGMTRKFCSDAALNTLDGDIAELLDRGAEIIISDNGEFLRLSNIQTALEFKRSDKMR